MQFPGTRNRYMLKLTNFPPKHVLSGRFSSKSVLMQVLVSAKETRPRRTGAAAVPVSAGSLWDYSQNQSFLILIIFVWYHSMSWDWDIIPSCKLFLLCYLLCFLIVESSCADTTVKKVNHLMNETVLFLKENEEFVLEPVDDTGQNLTSFLLNVCVTMFAFLLVSENICKTDYSHFRFHLLLLSEFHFTATVAQNQYQAISLICPNLSLHFLSKPSFAAVQFWYCQPGLLMSVTEVSSEELLLLVTHLWFLCVN